ncbi:MAG: N-acetylmuramoyl-L-alanine amidase [Oscillospiraceae bacterium]|nr:N-acetylmuramoyl-L-alanine amidase [Oscillospiraceae bacterium]
MKRFFKFILLLALLALGWQVYQNEIVPRAKVFELVATPIPDWVDQQIIQVDGDSRRGVMLESVRSIVIHYVGNPGSTAKQNRDYYANPSSEVSSHFVIGLNGEIIQCIPLHEKSSASNHRNRDTISIEVCHPDASGKFTEVSYQSLVKLTAWLCEICDLGSGDIIRHYDITGKQCPLYFVTHEDAWVQFRTAVAKANG